MGGKWNRWRNETSVVVGGKRIVSRPYGQWYGMTDRVAKGLNSYSNVSISENFKDYDWWCDWAYKQKGFLLQDINNKIRPIDKDIVGDGTIYSEDVCVFVPLVITTCSLIVRINLMLVGLVLERLREYLSLINMKLGWEHIVHI